MSKVKLKDVVKHLDLHALASAAAALGAEGHTKAEVVDAIVDLVDAAIPWDLVGPVGTTIDAIDGPVVKALAHFIIALGSKRTKA
jgi:hypothetical protein